MLFCHAIVLKKLIARNMITTYVLLMCMYTACTILYLQTPLTRACQFGHDKIVEYLLEKGAMAHPLALIKAIEGLYRYD